MKLFVITHKDLTPSQQAVQAGHVVAEYLLDSKCSRWRNQTLIYLGVKNLYELEKIVSKFESNDVPFYVFREPDRNNEITAIATDQENKIVKKLNLL